MCKKQATASVVSQVASQGILGSKNAAPVANIAEQQPKSGGILRSKAEVAAEASAQVVSTGPSNAPPVGVNVGQSAGGSSATGATIKRGRSAGGVGAGALGRRRKATAGLGL